MLRVIAVAVLTTSLFACSSSSRSPAVTASVKPTQDAGRIWLYDLRSFQRVESVGGLGRIPLGLYNNVFMRFAAARFDRFYAGDDLPQNARLRLSIVLGAPIEPRIDGTTGASYEWWFYTAPATDAATAVGDREASLRIAVRNADGVWGVYADTGGGWARVADATYQFGDFEVSADVHVDAAWGMTRDRSAFFRAVSAVENGGYTTTGGPIADIGYAYPPDLSWVRVWE